MKAVKQLELCGSDVAKVRRLEEEKITKKFSIVKDTWNKRRTNFPRKFAKSKVEAVPALKQGTLVIMTCLSRMSKRDEKIAEKFGTSFRSGAWQPGQKPTVNSSSLNIRDFMEGIAGMVELLLEVSAYPAELLAEALEFFRVRDILPS